MSEPRSPWSRLVAWVKGDPADAPPPRPPRPPVEPTELGIRAVLALIDDPELGVDLDDLGLLRGWDLDGVRLTVGIATTSPSCPVGPALMEQARAGLAAAYPQLDVEAVLSNAPPWSEADLSAFARVQLGRGGSPPEPTPGAALLSSPGVDALLDAFAALPLDAALIVASDTDPRPLATVLQQVEPGRCGWTWIERGPKRWRVELRRVAG